MRVTVAAVFALVATSCGGGDQPAAEKDTTSTIVATQKAPSREVWTGSWREGTAATMTSEGTFRLTVADDGSVSGQGSGTQSGAGVSATARFDVTITGTRDDAAFHLTFTSGGPRHRVIVPIRSRTATGPWRTGAGQAAYRGTITLECESC